MAAGLSMTNFKEHELWGERDLGRVINNGLRDGQLKPCCAVPTNEEWRAEQEERTPRVTWDAQPVAISADQAIAASNGAPTPRRAQAEVKAFLQELLKDGPGRRPRGFEGRVRERLHFSAA